MVGRTVLDIMIFQETYNFMIRNCHGDFAEIITSAHFFKPKFFKHLNTRCIVHSDFGVELFDTQLLYTCVFNLHF